MKKTIIKEFSPTREVLVSDSGKMIELVTTEEQPFDYDIIESIWEDISI